MSGQQSEDNIEMEPTLILRDSVDTIIQIRAASGG
jgi:hypothetical protein